MLFVYSSDVFFEVSDKYVCKCVEDVKVGFGCGVYFVRVLLDRHSSVMGHSKCCGSANVGMGV